MIRGWINKQYRELPDQPRERRKPTRLVEQTQSPAKKVLYSSESEISWSSSSSADDDFDLQSSSDTAEQSDDQVEEEGTHQTSKKKSGKDRHNRNRRKNRRTNRARHIEGDSQASFARYRAENNQRVIEAIQSSSGLDSLTESCF